MVFPSSTVPQKYPHNLQWLKTNLQTLWSSPQYCSICLENNGEFCNLDKHISIYENSASSTLRDVIDSIFNFHIEDLMPSGLICENCTEKVIHCYTFIENTKKLHKIIENCVNDLYSKATDINNELDDNTEYSDANVMIVVEYDTDICKNIDDLSSGQHAVLSDVPMSPIPEPKVQKDIKFDTNPTNIITELKERKGNTDIDLERSSSKEMVVVQTPRVIKHPRIINVTNNTKQDKDKNSKENEKLDPNKDLVKTTRTVGLTVDNQNKDTKETENSKENLSKVNKDKIVQNKVNKSKKEVRKMTPNVTLKDGKLLIKPLLTKSGPTVPRYNTYTCTECSEIFTSYRSLKEHEKHKHNLVIYKCRVCKKPYNSQQYLDMHYMTMHSKARCRFCFGLFDGANSLKKHLREAHGKLVYACPHCDLVYYSNDKLETHLKSTHIVTDTKNVNKTQCIMCLRNFVESELKTHKCRFACLDCPVVQKPCIHFNYLTSYREQILNHVSTIKCIDCDYTTKRKEHLISHVNREHLDYHPFVCDDCGTQFYTKLSLKTHIAQFHQELKCEYCDVEFKSVKFLENHRVVCQSVTRPYLCDKCVASFDTKEELNKHNEVGHSEFIFPCTLCKKEFHDVVSLGEHHARVHSGVQYKKRRRIIECTICDITFMNLREMIEHEKTHDSSEIFPCKVCPKNFKSLKKVYVHKQRHYSQKTKCEGCQKLVTSTYIQQHMAVCPFYNGLAENTYICEECGKSFGTEINLRMHQKTHMKAEACLHCGKKVRPHYMNKHMRMKHQSLYQNEEIETEVQGNRSKTLHCPACEYVTKVRTALENHINRIHLKIKPYVCPVCHKSFCGKFRLNDHMRTHSDEYVCYCPYCGKKLANKVCLKMHLRRHTGEHPYECNICLARFRTSSIMKTHRLKKHQDKTITCPLCDNMFHMATQMRFHVKKVHWKKAEPFDYKKIIPKEFHYMFEDRRLQKLGDASEETIPLL